MRLKEIQLAGFKSFVDATTVALPGNRAAVVGPNGCGKSNIVDAVRWVLGESSARQLRAEALTDVIFNGSNTRAPASLASVELVFDNRAGRVGGTLVEGKMANYAEIAVRREVGRDSQSTYYLNGVRCRRRDIADVFLGTGFGPRSYSIIEQGMISELTDAKPEELRGYLEEAAGVTKYKERRRETQNRIAHTVENLARLGDLREELERQLAHLKRQAKAAEKYRLLKEEERQRSAQLHAIRLAGVEAALESQTAEADALAAKHAEALSIRQTIDTELLRWRETHAVETESATAAQARFYGLGTAVSKLEQAIAFDRQRLTELEREGQVLALRQQDIEAQLAADAERTVQIKVQQQAVEPNLAASQAADAAAAQRLEALEREVRARQSAWQEHNRRVAENDGETRVRQNQLEHAQQLLEELQDRLDKLRAEPEAAPDDDGFQDLTRAVGQGVRQVSALASAVQANAHALAEAKRQASEREQTLEEARQTAQRHQAEHMAVHAAQEAALGRAAPSQAAAEWLRANGLAEARRLGENLSVAEGWERAVETVLRDDMQTIVVADGDGFAAHVAKLTAQPNGAGRTSLLAAATRRERGPDAPGRPPTLAGFVVGDYGSLLDGVYAADTLADAQKARRHLAPGESVVTRDGVWLGADWARFDAGLEQDSVLGRASELEALGRQAAATEADRERHATLLTKARQRVRELEQEREDLRTRHGDAAAELARVKGEHDIRNVRREEAEARARRNAAEKRELAARAGSADNAAQAARARLVKLGDEAERLATAGGELRAAHKNDAATVDAARQQARQTRDAYHRQHAESQTLAATLVAVETAHARLLEQQQELRRRADEQSAAMDAIKTALPKRQDELQERLAERGEAERQLKKLQQRLEAINAEMSKAMGKRNEAERAADDARERLEAARLECERTAAKHENIVGELRGTGIDRDEARQALAAADAQPDEQAWRERLEKLATRIARLGAINLAAIDEYETQSERKGYLDRQHADLEKALATLRGAIARIDSVTRARFKDTFNQVNKHLQSLFPKFFGGGSASLRLTGEDWLNTGVTLMAQPPGKRNSNIHLLSGGEKAMTAVALIFSIFQINPSPVCMLDEVDAPLDDTNVGRFADLIRELSSDVQFVLISHNKQTMEMADHLLGVTMQEAGVSRLVSVDVEQAAHMAAAG